VVARLVPELPGRAGGFRPVKRPVKALLITLAVLIALPLVVWTGTFFYWHFRILSGLRAWEKAAATQTPTVSYRDGKLPRETAETLLDAGCRALPYLVEALDQSTNPEFQEGVITKIIQAMNPPGPSSDEAVERFAEQSSRWQFPAEGLDLERKQKLSDFKTWWSGNRREHHSWWRVWSSNCRGARAGSGR
jgi:hypothetical protein